MAQGWTVELTLGPYVVRIVSDAATDLLLAEEGLEGDSDVKRGLIRLRSDLDYARHREVLVHELLHHVIHLTHLQVRWSEEEAEEVIRAIAPWLACAVTVAVQDA